jgi:hypothetical protein
MLQPVALELVRICVGLVAGDPERRIHLPGELPIRRVQVVAMDQGLEVFRLDSQQDARAGRALCWLPGDELELELETKLARDALIGRSIDWHVPTTPADQVVAIRYVTVNGHRLT